MQNLLWLFIIKNILKCNLIHKINLYLCSIKNVTFSLDKIKSNQINKYSTEKKRKYVTYIEKSIKMEENFKECMK